MERFIKNSNTTIEQLRLKINEDENFDKQCALFLSCFHNKLNFVQLLVGSGCDIHCPENEWDDRNAFQAACNGSFVGGNLPLVKFLIVCGSDIHKVTRSGYNGFLFACQRENIELVKYLIELGCDEQQTLAPGGVMNGTSMAVRLRNLELAELLIERGVFVPNENFLPRYQFGNDVAYLKNLETRIENRIPEIKSLLEVIDISFKEAGKYIIHVIGEFTFGFSNLETQLVVMQQHNENED